MILLPSSLCHQSKQYLDNDKTLVPRQILLYHKAFLFIFLWQWRGETMTETATDPLDERVRVWFYLQVVFCVYVMQIHPVEPAGLTNRPRKLTVLAYHVLVLRQVCGTLPFHFLIAEHPSNTQRQLQSYYMLTPGQPVLALALQCQAPDRVATRLLMRKQRTMEGIDGGLHPAVDGQSLGERWNSNTTDRGQWKALMEATSCSGWTKPRWKVKQESNRHRTVEGIDGGLHPAVDGQSLGERWKQQTEDNGRHWWRATSCSGWTKPRVVVWGLVRKHWRWDVSTNFSVSCTEIT